MMRFFSALNSLIVDILNSLSSVFNLAVRCFVGWQFFQSGLAKVMDWNSTLSSFQNEYQVPVLTPEHAAMAGAFGELFFPVLLFVGLATRFSAIALSVVNVVAVIAHKSFLLDPANLAVLQNHYLWGALLLMLVFYGGGKLTLDYLIHRRWG
ncbi:MAG: DoxX family protein [Gammaproteobacteria bacterium]